MVPKYWQLSSLFIHTCTKSNDHFKSLYHNNLIDFNETTILIENISIINSLKSFNYSHFTETFSFKCRRKITSFCDSVRNILCLKTNDEGQFKHNSSIRMQSFAFVCRTLYIYRLFMNINTPCWLYKYVWPLLYSQRRL